MEIIGNRRKMVFSTFLTFTNEKLMDKNFAQFWEDRNRPNKRYVHSEIKPTLIVDAFW